MRFVNPFPASAFPAIAARCPLPGSTNQYDRLIAGELVKIGAMSHLVMGNTGAFAHRAFPNLGRSAHIKEHGIRVIQPLMHFFR